MEVFMKKIVVLLCLVGVFVFGSISTQAAMTACNKTVNVKKSGYTVTSDSQAWFYADNSGSEMYYQIAYPKPNYQGMNILNWGNQGKGYTLTRINNGYSAVDGSTAYIHSIRTSKAYLDNCMWSTSNGLKYNGADVVGISGGVNSQALWFSGNYAPN